MTTRTPDSESVRLGRNHIAQAVFALAQPLGITDRALLERLAEQVILRLESANGRRPAALVALPGMEHLVAAPGRDMSRISLAEIRDIAEHILHSWGPTPTATAVAPSSPPASGGPTEPEETIEETAMTLRTEPKGEATPTIATPLHIPSPAPTGRRLDSVSGLSANALTILERRYLHKDADGSVDETTEGMFRRVAQNIASAERLYDPQADVAAWAERFYQLMVGLDFLPNSPTLMNAGTDIQQLSACFVLPVGDSIPEIFDAVKSAALIHQSGGGTGFAFSRLRPEGDVVRSTGGVASGPVSFMRVFDTGTEVIKQGGRRRGANMGILSVAHPDILKFIAAKERDDAFTNFNISVAATDAFMEAVKAGRDYDLVNPRSGQPAGHLNASDVFDRVVDGAWRNGDPGLVFIDRINAANPTPQLGAIESTNPCGEQPLLPYESCNLGSINLAQMTAQRVESSTDADGRVAQATDSASAVATLQGESSIDWAKLRDVVHLAVRFLDNVIDVNRFPLPEIEAATKRTRKIGLGVMGFADLLIRLGVAYDSDAAVAVAEEVMGFIEGEATAASAALAESRGVFPAFAGSVYDRPGMPRVRNATRTTIAPTGTLSIIAACSSGVEPLYALVYTRETRLPDCEAQADQFITLTEVNPYFEAVARERGFYSEALMAALAQAGSLSHLDHSIPDDVRRLFVTAHDIAPEWHVRLQAAFQKHVDNAVSKTINFAHDATRDDIARAYLLAYDLGCKGITVYRDRSRDRQILTVATQEERLLLPTVSGHIAPRRRPAVTTGTTTRISTGCGNLYVTINLDDRGMCEVFSTLGKAGGCAAAQSEAISRLMSLALRAGVEPDAIARQIKGIRCPSISWDEGHAILSCPDAIASIIERQLHGGVESDAEAQGEAEDGRDPVEDRNLGSREYNVAGQCPECSSLLIYAEGCFICRACGYTRCA